MARGRMLAAACAAATSGVLAVLATPGESQALFAASFFVLVPLLAAIDGAGVRHAFVLGHVTGMVAIAWGFSWISTLLERYAGLPGPAAAVVLLLFAAAFALQFSIPAAAFAYLRRRSGCSALACFPAAFALTSVLLPTIFPLDLAIVWAEHPRWIQLADVGGVTLVTFVVVSIHAGIYDTLRAAARRRVREALVRSAATVLVAGAVAGYGTYRMHAIDEALSDARRVRFGLVQGNMAIEEVFAPGGAEAILRKHQRASADLEREGAEILVWGETAYPFGPWLGRDRTEDLPPSHPYRIRRGFSRPLVVGYVDEAPGDPFPWNTARVLHEDGRFGDRYDKVYLLMFGEYVPLVDPEWFQSMFPTASHLHRGTGPAVLRVSGLRAGPLICYEDVLEGYVREVADLGVDVFVNLTNDAWFGKGREPHEHLALAVFRTVEHRRAMVRAVTTGVSAHIDPVGRIVARTRVTDPAVEGPRPADTLLADVAVVPAGTLETFYARWPFAAPVGYVLLLVLSARRRRSRRSPDGDTPT
ncbi:MAG: apolipoprotein N-acyltransferase [Deltaproteobacteria bacterium]|nr:MAG: apolipoprotein N-acyltransferase [Deltaproteobacteria bacterium]